MNQDAPTSNTRNGRPNQRKKPSGDIGFDIFARKREATKAARAKAGQSEKGSPTTAVPAPSSPAPSHSPTLVPASIIPVSRTKDPESAKTTIEAAATQPPKASLSPAPAASPRPREKANSPAKRTIAHSINNGSPGRQSPGAERAAHYLKRRPDAPRVYPGDKKGYDADFDRKATASPSPSRPIINKEKLVAEARLGKESPARPSSSASNKQLFEPKRERQPISRRASSHSSAAKQEDLAIFKRNNPPPKAQSEKEGSDSAPPTQPSRKLFDPRQHDPVNFSSKKDGESNHAKAESTLTTQDAGTKEAQKESHEKPSDEAAAAAENKQPVVERIKKAYKRVIELESKRVAEAEQEQQARSAAGFKRNAESAAPVLVLAGHEAQLQNDPVKDDAYWVDQVGKHRELTEAHHKFLLLSLDPRLPPSLHTLPQKYNIPSKLWQNGFHLLLERMRHAVPTTSEGSSPTQHLLEIWIDFIQYAYAFYTHLYEEESLRDFKHVWLEQLGDLARYRMAVVGMVTRMTNRKSAPGQELSLGHVKSLPNEVASARIDQESALQASIGDAALNDWEVEDHDVWKTLAIEWYGKGLAEAPGTGRLHHHLALLCRGDDMKTLYHFCRSMTASHPFQSARESILPLFEAEHQARRARPDATVLELFVHLHSLLFTQIQLDDFDAVLARFLFKLEESETKIADEEPLETSQWIRMAVVNIAACLQYGRDESVLRKALNKEPVAEKSTKGASAAPQALMVNPLATKSKSPEMQAATLPSAGSGDEGVTQAEANIRKLHVAEKETTEVSPAFSLALKLTFGMLKFAIRQSQQTKTAMPLTTPYISMLLTFVGQIATQPDALALIERDIPWRQLVDWFNTSKDTTEIKSEVPLKLSGPPLPEDWCLRGMEWNRQLFAKGYWKPQARSSRDVLSNTTASEIGVLNAVEQVAAVHPESDTASSLDLEEDQQRWRRAATIAAHLGKVISGLNLNAQATNGTPFRIVGLLKGKLDNWQAEDEEQARLALSPPAKTKWLDDDDDAPQEETVDSEVEISDVDDPDDSAEVKELKARRRELMAVIREARRKANSFSVSRQAGSKAKRTTRALHLVPGYTILVFDTNVILNSLSLFQAILESQRWTLVIPLVVLTELDGLRIQQDTELGQNAAMAILYLESKIKTHSIYLKFLTSRGNYLSDINIRREEVDFSSSNAQNMDDIVLQAALWQSEHFVNRLNMVWPNRSDKSPVSDKASKVALLTFDMNLRLKAKARQLDVLGEQDMVGLAQQKITSSSKKPDG